VYSGNENAAVITAANARTLAADVVGSASVSLIVAGIEAGQARVQTPGSVLTGLRLNRYVRDALNRVAASRRSTATLVVQETAPCGVSGTITFSGTLNDATLTGTLLVTFGACAESNYVLNGQLTFRIDAYDPTYNFFTDTTASFSALQVKTLTTIAFPGFPMRTVVEDVTAGGSLRSQVTITANREQISGNLVTRDNASGRLHKINNLVFIVDYNFVLFPSSYNLSISSARVFDSVDGYVDVTTNTPWFFAALDHIFPSSGGSLVLVGAQNARVAVTPVSTTQAKVELDLDANSVYELSSTIPWMALRPPAINTAPVANAGSSQSVPKGIALMLDGSASSDVEYDFLSYQWTLAQKPNGSLAQLSGATTVNPILTPDLEGSYVIGLVVSDGRLSGSAASITLTALNIAPVAVADPLFLGYNGVQVLLDGSQSSDGNNDQLIFNWSLTLKPQGSGVVLSGAQSATLTFIPDLAGIYRLSLAVNDGTISSPAVSVTVYAVVAPSSVAQIQVPGDYATIQAAIDAASPGNTIAVSPGTYTGNLNFNGKNVTLQSVAGPSRTIIEGSNGTAVQIGANGAIVGFTIRNAFGDFAGGMEAHGAGTLVKNNIFKSNTGFGAGIWGNNASPIIDANIFLNNSCDEQYLSGVISFVNTSSPLLVNNIMQNNPCRGINMTLPSGNTPQVINNTLVSNRAGIRVNRYTSVAQIYRNNIIVGNDVGFEVDGGTDADNPVWQNNLVFGNGANYSGTADQTGLSGNISADPSFLDQAGGVYYPNAGSPLVDQGNGTGAPSADFLGRTRPVDGNGDASAVVDIGAFEFQNP